MLTAIRFDDQARSRTGKVGNVASNWELTAEFPTFETLGAQ